MLVEETFLKTSMEFSFFFLLYLVPLGIPDKTKLHPQNFPRNVLATPLRNLKA